MHRFFFSNCPEPPAQSQYPKNFIPLSHMRVRARVFVPTLHCLVKQMKLDENWISWNLNQNSDMECMPSSTFTFSMIAAGLTQIIFLIIVAMHAPSWLQGTLIPLHSLQDYSLWLFRNSCKTGVDPGGEYGGIIIVPRHLCL